MPLDQSFLREFMQVIADATTQSDITVEDLHMDITDALNAGETDLKKIVQSLRSHFKLTSPDYQADINEIIADEEIETLYQLAERIHDIIELG